MPAEWAGQEVRLRWDSGGEAMVWEWGEPQQVGAGKPTTSYQTAESCFKFEQHDACSASTHVHACTSHTVYT